MARHRGDRAGMSPGQQVEHGIDHGEAGADDQQPIRRADSLQRARAPGIVDATRCPLRQKRCGIEIAQTERHDIGLDNAAIGETQRVTRDSQLGDFLHLAAQAAQAAGTFALGLRQKVLQVGAVLPAGWIVVADRSGIGQARVLRLPADEPVRVCLGLAAHHVRHDVERVVGVGAGVGRTTAELGGTFDQRDVDRQPCLP